MAKNAKAAGAQRNVIMAPKKRDRTDGAVLAEIIMGEGGTRPGHTINTLLKPFMEGSGSALELMDLADLIDRRAEFAASGNLGFASAMLAAQATTLDTMFTELARRSALNLGQYIEAGERYARLAFKAQANCRATLEALAKLHQPREQTVRHVHVNEGGHAIVADNFHHHTGGAANAENAEQSHATGGAGGSPALPCQDALGDIMPGAGGSRPTTMSDARRD